MQDQEQETTCTSKWSRKYLLPWSRSQPSDIKYQASGSSIRSRSLLSVLKTQPATRPTTSCFKRSTGQRRKWFPACSGSATSHTCMHIHHCWDCRHHWRVIVVKAKRRHCQWTIKCPVLKKNDFFNTYRSLDTCHSTSTNIKIARSFVAFVFHFKSSSVSGNCRSLKHKTAKFTPQRVQHATVTPLLLHTFFDTTQAQQCTTKTRANLWHRSVSREDGSCLSFDTLL